MKTRRSILCVVFAVLMVLIFTACPEPGVPVTGVTLNKTTMKLTTIGGTETLTATVAPNKAVTWTSSNTAVATVSAAGLVTADGESGNTVYFCLRYENAKGFGGPFGHIFKTVIL